MARALKARRPDAPAMPPLPYGRQLIEDDDIAAVTEALRSDFLTTGPTVARFEVALAESVGARHAVVCASGTAALYMAARALDLGPGKTIVVPAITFLATANAPHLNGADIVFCDVDPQTGLMRPEDLQAAIARAGHVDAVFNVHLNGQCGALEEIASIAREAGAAIVDDSCHALGTAYVAGDGTIWPIGSNAFADLSVFSFHPVKAIAMGEGGAVTTNDPAMAQRLMRARNHGMTRHGAEWRNHADGFNENGAPNRWYYEMAEPEFNWRASDIQCALGLSQLRKLGRFVTRRRALAAHYDQHLSSFGPILRPLHRTRPCLPAWHIYAVHIDFAAAGIGRDALMGKLAEEGIGTQVHYYPVHRQPYYADRYTTPVLRGADRYYERALSIPLFASMREKDVLRVVEALARHLGL
jgi:UDP-4-amino-4,6-dideoxy-N-acetyl-beta-L-altrosamine transaminase